MSLSSTLPDAPVRREPGVDYTGRLHLRRADQMKRIDGNSRLSLAIRVLVLVIFGVALIVSWGLEDPSDIAPSIKVFQSVIITLSALAGATVAIVGLQTWRDQLLSEYQLKYVRRLFSKVLHVRDAVHKACAFRGGPFDEETTFSIGDKGRKLILDQIKGQIKSLNSDYENISNKISAIKIDLEEVEFRFGVDHEQEFKPLFDLCDALLEALFDRFDYLQARQKYQNSTVVTGSESTSDAVSIQTSYIRDVEKISEPIKNGLQSILDDLPGQKSDRFFRDKNEYFEKLDIAVKKIRDHLFSSGYFNRFHH